MTELLDPLLLTFISLYALIRKQDVYALLLSGAREGLSTLLSIAPSLIVLLTGISMLRSSGFFAWMAQALAPVFRFLGMPPELAPLMLVRPVSGSAALAVGAELMKPMASTLSSERPLPSCWAAPRRRFIPSASILAPPASATRAIRFLPRCLQILRAFSWRALQRGSF